jgi:hypothetical protein
MEDLIFFKFVNFFNYLLELLRINVQACFELLGFVGVHAICSSTFYIKLSYYPNPIGTHVHVRVRIEDGFTGTHHFLASGA